MKIKLTYLYPDLCGLYGDRGNAMAIKRLCEKLNLSLQIDRVNDIGDRIDFDHTDLMLLSPGELSTFPNIVEDLKANIEALKAYIESGGYFFAIGSSACVFAKRVNRINRPSYQGLDIGYFDCQERKSIYGDDLIFTCEMVNQKREVSSSQIQTVDILASHQSQRFGKIVYGYGNHHNTDEGIRYKNLIITNALGPLFVKNPWILLDVIADIVQKKGEKLDTSKINFFLEKKSFEVSKKFNLHKKTSYRFSLKS